MDNAALTPRNCGQQVAAGWREGSSKLQNDQTVHIVHATITGRNTYINKNSNILFQHPASPRPIPCITDPASPPYKAIVMSCNLPELPKNTLRTTMGA